MKQAPFPLVLHHIYFVYFLLLTGSFEVEINGQLIFSKLETGGFPYEDDVSIVTKVADWTLTVTRKFFNIGCMTIKVLL